MADIALRNPQFKEIIITQPFASVVCVISINGSATPIYTLVKNIQPINQAVVFDIAELVRDYLDITYQSSYVPQTIDIESVLTPYADPNGTGQPGTAVTYNDRGFEAYGIFTEEINPEVPFNRSAPTYLIANNEQTTSSNTFTILAPNNKAGKIPSITSLTGLVATAYNSNDTSVTSVDGVVCNIKRIDCTKYGDGKKITFINKYGAQQDLWFFLKNTRNVLRTNEGYKSNTITYPVTGVNYSIQNAPNKVFNTQAKQTLILSSGYYPEFANQFFEELLLSEFIWIERELSDGVSRTPAKIPVKVKTSSIEFKTVLNDKLIEYTIEFEEAFDYINNIR